MAGLRTHRTYDITVPAGGEIALHVAGQFVTCITSSLADFRLGLDEEAESLFFQGAHVGVEREQQFRAVRVRNPSGGALTVTLIIGFGEFKDSRLSVSAPIDISDRAGRLLGGVDLLTLGQVLDNVGRGISRVTNPSAGQILADTGDLPAGLYIVLVQTNSSAVTPLELSVRSADDGTLTSIAEVFLDANVPSQFPVLLDLALDEEIELSARNAVTGTVVGGMQWMRLRT